MFLITRPCNKTMSFDVFWKLFRYLLIILSQSSDETSTHTSVFLSLFPHQYSNNFLIIYLCSFYSYLPLFLFLFKIIKHFISTQLWAHHNTIPLRPSLTTPRKRKLFCTYYRCVWTPEGVTGVLEACGLEMMKFRGSRIVKTWVTCVSFVLRH